MRVRTESKRAELVAAAVSVFAERGYEQTSMEDIRERAGCSKGTLYSYFASKDELFLLTLLEVTEQEASALVSQARGRGESGEAFLTRFGLVFLQTLYAPSFQALRRLAFSSPNSEVGRSVYSQVVKPYEVRVANVLSELMEAGVLRRADPEVAANHFGGLLESEFLIKFLLRAIDVPTKAQLKNAASRAVAAFLAAYSIG